MDRDGARGPLGPGALQTAAERDAGRRIAEVFNASPDDVEARLANFPRYARRSHVTRFIALYELFRRNMLVKGSIIDLGVFRGFSFFTWGKLSAALEPNNLTRRIYGFDSFAGFPSVNDADEPDLRDVQPGDLSAGQEELRSLIEIFDQDRFLGHLSKMQLIVGDMTATVPKFLADNPHLVVSLLFCDADLYEPTQVALEYFLPRMPRGAILAFDELDNPKWPGETLALLKTVGLNNLELKRFEFDPYIAYVEL